MIFFFLLIVFVESMLKPFFIGRGANFLVLVSVLPFSNDSGDKKLASTKMAKAFSTFFFLFLRIFDNNLSTYYFAYYPFSLIEHINQMIN